MVIGDISKDDVVTCVRTNSIQEVAALMRKAHVGDVVVVEEDGEGQRPIGIVTDRDLVVELLATQVDMQSVSVGDVMSWQVVQADENDEIPSVIDAMRAAGVRRMPVVNAQGMLTGIVTVDDLIDWLADALRSLGKLIVRERDIEVERRTRA